MALPAPSTVSIVVIFSSLLILRLFYLAVYRLFFHPLAKVPGEKLAALTSLYEIYYDSLLQGKFVYRIDDAHGKYGPVVRISPNEVHIDDPDFFDQLYSASMKLNKDGKFYRFVGAPSSAFGSESSTMHRQRRRAFDRFFGPSAMNSLEEQTRKCVLHLCSRLEEFRGTGKSVLLASAVRSMTTDTISQYVLPKGFDLLSTRDFGEDYNNVNRKLSGVAAWNRHFPFIIPLMMSMPTWILKFTASPGMLQMLEFQGHNQAQAREITSTTNKPSDASVLHGVFNSDLPTSDKTAARIFQEALTLVGAGSETTGSALEHTMFHILNSPDIKSELNAELSQAVKTAGGQVDSLLSKDTLRSLPYLNAVVKEGLRLGNKISGRLPRYDPINAITYKSHTFPPGTIIGMSIRDIHLSPSAFPDPLTFNPNRFLNPDTKKSTEKYFVAFGKGARSCVGRELAMLELTMAIANLVYRFDTMRLYQTVEADVLMDRDFFSPFRRDDSKGLQVTIS